MYSGLNWKLPEGLGVEVHGISKQEGIRSEGLKRNQVVTFDWQKLTSAEETEQILIHVFSSCKALPQGEKVRSPLKNIIHASPLTRRNFVGEVLGTAWILPCNCSLFSF